MSLGKRLNEIRIENGLTVKELSKILQVNEETIKGWESERRKPRYKTYV